MDPFASYKAAQKAGAGFAPLAANTTISAAKLVAFAGVSRGAALLDVACGTGVVAITAARLGARVTALDLTPELLAVARENGRVAGTDVEWHEGEVEELPFPDSTFDVVTSQFGHMFAPRAAVAAGEMLRVLKPGGTIAFSTWPAEHFIGRMFAMVGAYLPPPPNGSDPLWLWGDQQVIRERLGSLVRDLTFTRDVIHVPVLSPAHYREMTEKMAGPVFKLVESLKVKDPAKLDSFRREYDALTAQYFDRNTVRQDYLMTKAIKN